MGKEYLDITAEDFVLAKTDDEVFNKIYKANVNLAKMLHLEILLYFV